MKNTSGLGTPATRADIIEKLFSAFYMERHGKELVPTSKGVQLVSIVPADLKSAELTAKWEQQLTLISKGQARSETFLESMRAFASKLVSGVIASDGVYHHDNQTHEKCPDCSKFLLAVNGKKGKMLVCPDRECGYRKSVSFQTNARCPNCHKKLEMRGEGDNRLFVCVCGYREKYADFEKRRADSGANKREVEKYLSGQTVSSGGGNFAMAAALAKWQEKNQK
jgi:DNA topoisomerase-3